MDSTDTKLRHLTPTRCWELLEHQDIGRLAIVLAGQPEIFPVNYKVLGRTIVVRTDDGPVLTTRIRRNGDPMTVTPHPVHYVVQANRNNTVVHMQEATSYDDAQRMKERIESIPHTTADIIEVHDPAETDLTTHTREIVEDIASRAHD